MYQEIIKYIQEEINKIDIEIDKCDTFYKKEIKKIDKKIEEIKKKHEKELKSFEEEKVKIKIDRDIKINSLKPKKQYLNRRLVRNKYYEKKLDDMCDNTLKL